MTKAKGVKWDGKSRVSNDLYRKNFNDIFKKEQDELNESYKQSIRNKKEKDYNFAVWNRIKNQTDLTSFTNKLGITSMVKNVNNDPAFVSRIPKVIEFLVNRKSFWANALESQMKAFFRDAKLKSGNDYFIMRADMIPNSFNPYEVYKKISKKDQRVLDLKNNNKLIGDKFVCFWITY